MTFFRYHFFFLTPLCLAVFFGRFAAAQEPVSQELVLEILALDEILSLEQRSVLREFSLQLDMQSYQPEELSTIAGAVAGKARRDLHNLSDLTYNLTELLENGYAQKIGKVRRRDLDGIIEKIEQLEGASKGLYKQKALDQDKLSAQDLIKAITHDIAVLTGEGGLPGHHAVWQELKDEFADAYKRWNAHYQKLETSHQRTDEKREIYGIHAKKRFFEEPIASSQEYSEQKSRYDTEQLAFLRDFVRAQAIFRRLSSPNSSDF
jgi:hypothetical protein